MLKVMDLCLLFAAKKSPPKNSQAAATNNPVSIGYSLVESESYWKSLQVVPNLHSTFSALEVHPK